MATNEEEHPPPASDNEAAANGQEDSDEPDEYSVEAIRKKRLNKDGIVEYLIKWQDYPESANTWEPIDNLSCPELIAKFNETEKNKQRKRRSIQEPKESQAKRSRPIENLLVEDELDNLSSTETLSSTDSKQREADTAPRRPKGFERGKPIEHIVGSCTDDEDKLWFFVKWQGVSELELVESTELEDKEPRILCQWYRERLYYSIKNPDLNCQPVS